RCFDIERRLDEALDLPVFHDDQHGTAIVVLAALRNAAKLLDRKLSDLRVVVAGAGAAGVAVTKMLIAGGVSGATTVVCDSRGIIHRGRTDLNGIKTELAELTNAAGRTGDIEAALTGADVLIGVSGGTIPQSAVADRKSTRLNSSHVKISYAVFCLKKKKHESVQNLVCRH